MLTRSKRLEQENSRLVAELERLRPLVAQLQRVPPRPPGDERNASKLRIDMALSQAADDGIDEIEPLRALPDPLSERDETIAALEKEVIECKRRISEQQAELASAHGDAERHSKAASALGRLISHLRPHPVQTEDQGAEQQLQEARDRLQDALEVVRSQDEELERNAHMSKRLIDALEGQLGRVRAALAGGDSGQAVAAASLNVGLAELNALHAQVAQLQGRAAQQDARIRELEAPRGRRETASGAAAALEATRARVAQMQVACAEHVKDLRWLETALSESTRREKKLDAVVADQSLRLDLLADQLSGEVSVVEGLRCTLLVVQQRLSLRNAVVPRSQPSVSKRESQLQALARALETNLATTSGDTEADIGDAREERESHEERRAAADELREAQELIVARTAEISDLTAKLRDKENHIAAQDDFIRSELSWRAFTLDAEKARGDLLQMELDGLRAHSKPVSAQRSLKERLKGYGHSLLSLR